jgi:hypothetical protein
MRLRIGEQRDFEGKCAVESYIQGKSLRRWKRDAWYITCLNCHCPFHPHKATFRDINATVKVSESLFWPPENVRKSDSFNFYPRHRNYNCRVIEACSATSQMGLSSILQHSKRHLIPMSQTSTFSAGKLLSVPKKGQPPIRKTIQSQTIQIQFPLRISGSVLNRIIQRLNILLLELSYLFSCKAVRESSDTGEPTPNPRSHQNFLLLAYQFLCAQCPKQKSNHLAERAAIISPPKILETRSQIQDLDWIREPFLSFTMTASLNP